MKTVVGDLGCSGVDVNKWRSSNLAILYPDHVNNWLLARENDSLPTESVIKSQLVGFFAKSFEREISDWSSQVVGLSNVGPCDNIQIIGGSQQYPPFKAVQRREQLPYGPLPLLKSTNVIYLIVSFNYRGILNYIPWPVAKRGLVAKLSPSGYDFCPVDADCMLVAVGEAGAKCSPKKTLLSALSSGAGELVSSATTAYIAWFATTAFFAAAGLYTAKRLMK